jgi:hypothetical protein
MRYRVVDGEIAEHFANRDDVGMMLLLASAAYVANQVSRYDPSRRLSCNRHDHALRFHWMLPPLTDTCRD